jgi:hypothetical protein
MKTLTLVSALSLTLAASMGRAEPPEMLLAALLATIDNLTASLTNAAENFAAVNGAVMVSAQGNADVLAATIPALAQDAAFGSRSQISATLSAREVGLAPRAVALTQLGDLATTAIGALQSGALLGSTGTTGTFDTSGLTQNLALQTTTASTTASMTVQTYGSAAQLLAMQNVAYNRGQIDGRISLVLTDVDATIDRLTSTAIGAMESGGLTAQLTGTLTQRLVGE